MSIGRLGMKNEGMYWASVGKARERGLDDDGRRETA